MGGMPQSIYLIASGDLRLAANRNCWAAQQRVEEAVQAAVAGVGREIVRAHPFQPEKGHGFIDSQKYGMEVFRQIPADAPLMVVEAVWQYSHHVLPGLWTHRGPILTVANWSGEWPGLVGMLNLNGCLTKAGVPFSTLWSDDFTDEFFLNGLRRWLKGEPVIHDTSHVRSLGGLRLPAAAAEIGAKLAAELRRDKAIMGIFDEGCMGMYNAIIPDELLHATGVFKETAEPVGPLCRDAHGFRCRSAGGAKLAGLARHAVRHRTEIPKTDLTDAQILDQCKMYIAALRIADRVRLRHHRHPVPAGAQGPDTGFGPGGRTAEQRGPAAGTRSRDRQGAVRGPGAAAFQRGG